MIMSEGGIDNMKEMLKSKGMVLFIVIVLGITYTGSLTTERLEDEKGEEYRSNIAMNVR